MKICNTFIGWLGKLYGRTVRGMQRSKSRDSLILMLMQGNRLSPAAGYDSVGANVSRGSGGSSYIPTFVRRSLVVLRDRMDQSQKCIKRNASAQNASNETHQTKFIKRNASNEMPQTITTRLRKHNSVGTRECVCCAPLRYYIHRF